MAGLLCAAGRPYAPAPHPRRRPSLPRRWQSVIVKSPTASRHCAFALSAACRANAMNIHRHHRLMALWREPSTSRMKRSRQRPCHAQAPLEEAPYRCWRPSYALLGGRGADRAKPPQGASLSSRRPDIVPSSVPNAPEAPFTERLDS